MSRRVKTNYPGVYFIEGIKENIFYISYYKNGKRIEEKAGRQKTDAMTAARANQIRAQRSTGKQKSNKERRQAIEDAKKAKDSRWTIKKLWDAYSEGRAKGKSLGTDKSRYEKYLKARFGNQEPKDIVSLDVNRLRIKLLKEKSEQTVLHILNLLTWVVNYGVKNGLCPGLSFHIKKPTARNLVTEDLTPTQIKDLLTAIDADTHPQAGPMMKLALFSGMRRGEMFKLKWKHVDFERGFINIKDPKGGQDQTIPLNDSARELLENHPRTQSPFVFPGLGGRQRVNIGQAVNEIKKNAGLPAKFRPLHGLRHVFASTLASSGQVDMYVLQKLLTHKGPAMTQRYAHLRDETLKTASQIAGDIFKQAAKKKDKSNVVNMKK